MKTTLFKQTGIFSLIIGITILMHLIMTDGLNLMMMLHIGALTAYSLTILWAKKRWPNYVIPVLAVAIAIAFTLSIINPAPILELIIIIIFQLCFVVVLVIIISRGERIFILNTSALWLSSMAIAICALAFVQKNLAGQVSVAILAIAYPLLMSGLDLFTQKKKKTSVFFRL